MINEPRAVVYAFAHLMERVLQQNDHKGGWEDDTPGWLYIRLCDEVLELGTAIENGTFEDIWKEAADIANFAMMIVDVTGGLQ